MCIRDSYGARERQEHRRSAAVEQGRSGPKNWRLAAGFRPRKPPGNGHARRAPAKPVSWREILWSAISRRMCDQARQHGVKRWFYIAVRRHNLLRDLSWGDIIELAPFDGGPSRSSDWTLLHALTINHDPGWLRLKRGAVQVDRRGLQRVEHQCRRLVMNLLRREQPHYLGEPQLDGILSLIHI